MPLSDPVSVVTDDAVQGVNGGGDNGAFGDSGHILGEYPFDDVGDIKELLSMAALSNLNPLDRNLALAICRKAVTGLSLGVDAKPREPGTIDGS